MERVRSRDMAAGHKEGRSRPLVRLVILLGLFIVLTALGVWWASPNRAELARAWRHFASLPAAIHGGVAGLAIGLLGAEMLRLVVMGRALGAKVGFWAALDATIANNFFSWITPGSALGEPAATYMLGRRGVPWDAAVLIAFGKFAISFAFIFGAAFLLVAAGLGPPIPSWVLLPIAGAVGFFALLFAVLVMAAFWPERAVGIIESLQRALAARRLFQGERAGRALGAICKTAQSSVERLGRFRQAGLGHWLAILATQVLYHAVFIGVFLLLAAAFEARSLADTVPVAIVYQGFLYLAPTPGSSGLGEASANVFFGDLLPGGAAFTVVVLFRAFTYYLHVLLGLVYLPLVGGLREILQGRRASP